MCLMCITLCMRISIAITLLSKVLLSEFFSGNVGVLDSISLLIYSFCVCWLVNCLVSLANRFFKESSVEERDHAEMLMEYQVLGHFVSFHKPYHLSLVCNTVSFFFGFLDLQNKRGGKVKLQPMVMPQSEFDHPEKGDALYGKLYSPFLIL